MNNNDNNNNNNNNNTKTKKKNVFQKLLNGICNPSKVLNHVILEEPKALSHNQYDHSSLVGEMEAKYSSPPLLVAEHEPPGPPSWSSSTSRVTSSLHSKGAIPLVRRVSFQDQSHFDNSSSRSRSNNYDNNNNYYSSYRTMDSRNDTIKIKSDEIPGPHDEMKKAPRRLTMTHILIMTVSSLLLLFMAAVIATTAAPSTTTNENASFSALFVWMPTRVSPLLPTVVSRTITVTSSNHLPTTLTTLTFNSTTSTTNNNNNTNSLFQDEHHSDALPFDSTPTESVMAIVNHGWDSTMGMVDYDHDIDVHDPVKGSKVGWEKVKPLQLPHHEEQVVHVDDMFSMSERDEADHIDTYTGGSTYQQEAEQEVDEANEDEENESSMMTQDTSEEDTQEADSDGNPENTRHIDEDKVADDAYNKDSKIEGASNVVTTESHVAQVNEIKNEESVSDDIVMGEAEIEDKSVCISEELTAVKQVDEGRISDNAVADARMREKVSATSADHKAERRGRARVGEKPDLQDWMVYSNVSMAIAFSMAIVSSWVDNRNAPVADSNVRSGAS